MREMAEGRRKRGSKKPKPEKKDTQEGDNEGDADLTALDNADIDSESALSGSGAPSEYEQMLQRYEAEVRNHIKIEQ